VKSHVVLRCASCKRGFLSDEYVVRFQHKADIQGVKERMLKAVSGVTMLNKLDRGGLHDSSTRSSQSSHPRGSIGPSDGTSALLKAVRLQNIAQVRCLLEHGFSSDGEEPTDGSRPVLTPLVAACKIGHVIITQLLLNHTASTALASEGGLTPLHAACNARAIACCQILIAQGADVDVAADDGKRPLHCACAVGAAKCAEALLRAGADVEKQTPEGELPLHTLCINVEASILTQAASRAKRGFETSDFAGCAKVLADAGSPFENKFMGRRAIQYAAHSDSNDVVEFLLSAGAKPLPKANKGNSGGQGRRASKFGPTVAQI